MYIRANKYSKSSCTTQFKIKLSTSWLWHHSHSLQLHTSLPWHSKRENLSIRNIQPETETASVRIARYIKYKIQISFAQSFTLSNRYLFCLTKADYKFISQHLNSSKCCLFSSSTLNEGNEMWRTKKGKRDFVYDVEREKSFSRNFKFQIPNRMRKILKKKSRAKWGALHKSIKAMCLQGREQIEEGNVRWNSIKKRFHFDSFTK